MVTKNHTETLTAEQLDREFQSFYEFCKENNITEQEMSKICEPLLKVVRKNNLVRTAKLCVMISLVVTTVFLMCSAETVAWHLSAIGRILMIKLLPFYDWTVFKNEICLIPKNTVGTTENRFDCALCETIEQIEIFDEIDVDAFDENNIKLHVPFLVAGGSENWKIYGLPVKNLTEILDEDEQLATSFPCKLSSSVHRGRDELSAVVSKTDRFNSYFIHFQNCEREATKRFRILASRPEFLHPRLSPVQYSWLLLNKNYNVTKFKPIELTENIAVVGQTLGRTFFRLVPQKDCFEECHVLEVELREGEAMVLTSLWNLEYKPRGFGENVAVILETR